jgi:hypothetical protein
MSKSEVVAFSASDLSRLPGIPPLAGFWKTEFRILFLVFRISAKV